MNASPCVIKVCVREMTLDDIPAVLRIDRQSFSMPWPERSYLYELTENRASHLLVAERPGPPAEVVGYVGFWLVLDEAHISTLAVDPRCRRQGLGDLLLKEGLARAADRGARLATLEVRASNQAALDLYQKYSFEIVGRRKGYYRDDDEDALLMTLDDLPGRLAEMIGGDGWVQRKS